MVRKQTPAAGPETISKGARMARTILIAATLMFCSMTTGPAFAADAALPAEIKTKIDAKISVYKAWSNDPEIVKAVKEHNANPPAEYKDMTNEKWKTLTVMSPEVKAFSKNALAAYIKSKKDSSVTEAFVSGADGTKVTFLSKTTYWCHKGKAKHDTPMTGKIWTGPVEVDESTGIQAVQVGFPVLDAGKPIGSIVLGFCVAKL
jgi:hypothetical protein